MGNIDGFEASRQINALLKNGRYDFKVKIVAITGQDIIADSVKKERECGIEKLYKKPL